MFLITTKLRRPAKKPDICENTPQVKLRVDSRDLLVTEDYGIDHVTYRLNGGAVGVFTVSQNAITIEDFMDEFIEHLGTVINNPNYKVLNWGGAQGMSAITMYPYTAVADVNERDEIKVTTYPKDPFGDSDTNVATTLEIFFEDDSSGLGSVILRFDEFEADPNSGYPPSLRIHSCSVRGGA